MSLGGGETRITLTKHRIGNIAVDFVLEEILHVRFAVKAAVGDERRLLQDIVVIAELAHALARALEHRHEQPVLLRLAKSLCRNDDLMLRVHHGNPVVALDDALAGLHLGALIIGDVALHHSARCADLILTLPKEPFDFRH